MTKPKKQHYVPQFLLRNFSIGRKEKAKVWVLDKRKGKVFFSSVRDIGHENQFYEYHGDNGTFELEDLMGKLDTKGADIIARITEKKHLPEAGEGRAWLSYVIAAQMLRTPTTRNDMENFRQMVIQKWGENIRFNDDDRAVGEYGPEDAKANSLQMLIKDVPNFAKMLQEKEWCLSEAPPSAPFIISDNPVTRHNMIDRGLRGNLGLKNDGIEIYLPLSPKLSLHLMCPKLSLAVLRTPDLAVPYSRSLIEGTPVPVKPVNVEFANSLQVIWAERFVYAREREHLEMPLDMLRTNPDLKEGPGVRQKPGEV